MKKNKGFTLIEALIATSIFAFCALSLFASFFMGYNMVNDIKENLTASSAIQKKIEELRKYYFSALPSVGETSFSNPALSSLYNASASVKVDQYVDSNIVRVTVKVTWYARLNNAKQNTKRVTTLITKNGINSI